MMFPWFGLPAEQLTYHGQMLSLSKWDEKFNSIWLDKHLFGIFLSKGICKRLERGLILTWRDVNFRRCHTNAFRRVRLRWPVEFTGGGRCGNWEDGSRRAARNPSCKRKLDLETWAGDGAPEWQAMQCQAEGTAKAEARGWGRAWGPLGRDPESDGLGAGHGEEPQQGAERPLETGCWKKWSRCIPLLKGFKWQFGKSEGSRGVLTLMSRSTGAYVS